MKTTFGKLSQFLKKFEAELTWKMETPSPHTLWTFYLMANQLFFRSNWRNEKIAADWTVSSSLYMDLTLIHTTNNIAILYSPLFGCWLTSDLSVLQMMDMMCVKVQDHLNSLRFTETSSVQEDMKVAENLMKDARNSKTVRGHDTYIFSPGLRHWKQLLSCHVHLVV